MTTHIIFVMNSYDDDDGMLNVERIGFVGKMRNMVLRLAFDL